MKRGMPMALAIVFFVVPLFPAFITLTSVSVPGVSLVPQPLAYTLLAIMGIAALYGMACLTLAPREPVPMLKPLLLWLAATLLAGLLGFDPRGGLLFIAILGLSIVWHVSIYRFFPAPNVAKYIFWSFLVSGALAALAAIAMVILRLPVSQYTIGHGRAIGTFILPGELAGYLIIYLPLAYAITRVSRDRALRAVAWIGLAVGGAAFALTFSRTGWMGFATAVAFYATATQRIRRRYAALILIAGLAVDLVVFNAHHNPSENYTRLSIWEAGLEIVRRFPLTGVGPFDFARIYPLVRLPDGDATAFHAHSFLLTVFAETGVVGLCAVLYAWWRFAVAVRDGLRTAPPANAVLALAVVAGLVGTWVQGLIDTVSVVIFGLWFPAMALALACLRYGVGEDAP